MSFLDVQTVMLSHVLTDAVCTAVLALLWVQNRKRFAGTCWWVIDFAFQTAAALLIVARGTVPAWLSISFSSILVVAGAFFGFIGLTRFVGRRTFQIHNYVLLAALLVVHLYFVFVQLNLAARNLNLSIGLLVISFQCAWLVLRSAEHVMRRMARWVGAVFGVFCIVSIARIVVIVSQAPANNDFFRSGAYDTLLVMAYQMLLILLTFALTLMINQRLVRDVQTQEEIFTKAFRSSPYAITLTRLSDNKLMDVNDGFVNITGYSSAEAVGNTALDLQLWVSPAERAASISELSQGKRVVGKEYQFRRRSGELMTGLFSSEIIRIDDMQWVLSTIVDITERNRAEEALRKSEDKFKDIFESANVGKSITLPTGAIKVNRAFCNLLGYTQEELEAKTWQELTPPVDINLTQHHIDQLLAGQKDSVRFTKRFIHKNGSLVWTDVSSALRRDGEGKPLHFITTIVDITERRQAEESLAISEANLLSLLESTDDIIASRDREGRVIAFNKAFASIMRNFFGVEATPGMDTSDYLTAEVKAHWEEVMAKVMSGESQHYEYSQEYGGSMHHYELGLTPIRVGGEIVGSAEFTREITARKRVEDQLRQAQKMETVGQLAGGVAHDFNNMLQVITSYVEMSLTKVEAGQPLHKYLLEVRRAAQRSADITGQLLAFARKQTVSPKVLDLNAAVVGTQKMIQRLIGEDIDLTLMPGRELWNVKIDPTQLDQILANLTVNARDAIDGVGTLVIETENVRFDEAYCATHPDFVAGEYVLLAVSDDGRGMDKETMSHLFEPFFTTKGPGKGTGLGLATIYGIVRQNNGFVNAYSEPGQGTTFRVYLPRAKGETVSGQWDAEAAALRGGTETVLVVEDEEAILELALESLKQLGYTVLTASSPQEAMRICREQPGPIHLLITDVVMPQMNGRQLADRLRAERTGLKCLFMSGYTADVIANRGVLEEGVSFIGKPFSLATLANKVRETLDA